MPKIKHKKIVDQNDKWFVSVELISFDTETFKEIIDHIKMFEGIYIPEKKLWLMTWKNFDYFENVIGYKYIDDTYENAKQQIVENA